MTANTPRRMARLMYQGVASGRVFSSATFDQVVPAVVVARMR